MIIGWRRWYFTDKLVIHSLALGSSQSWCLIWLFVFSLHSISFKLPLTRFSNILLWSSTFCNLMTLFLFIILKVLLIWTFSTIHIFLNGSLETLFNFKNPSPRSFKILKGSGKVLSDYFLAGVQVLNFLHFLQTIIIWVFNLTINLLGKVFESLAKFMNFFTVINVPYFPSLDDCLEFFFKIVHFC